MGYKIKEIRESQGITQEQLSEKSGVSRATISSLENGTSRSVMTKTLLRISSALGVKLEDIFFEEVV